MKQKHGATDVRRPFPHIAAEDPVTMEVLEQAARLAKSDLNLLIVGETGVGKEMLAKGIHDLGCRVDGPFYPLDVSAFPDTLIEGELFGHEKGAYTGAGRPYAGRLTAVAGGTLFLDEIGHLSRPAQVMLLRLLEDKQYYRLGKARALPFEARVIAATDQDVAAMVAAGTFLASLYHRFTTLKIPPLRERRADIPAMVRHHMRVYHQKYDKPLMEVSAEAMAYLQAQPWPGNGRQLVKTLEQAVVCAPPEQRVLEVDDFKSILQVRDTSTKVGVYPRVLDGMRHLGIHQILRMVVRERLDQFRGNKTKAAESLGVTRQTFHNLCKKYGIGQ